MRESAPTAPALSLRRLLPEATFHACHDLGVSSCTADSRQCRAGDLFAALVGTQVDGHDFVADAIESGATAVLAERYLPVRGRPLIVVPDAREAFGRICQALAGDPSTRLKTIGVTGTSGKTTTAWLIAGVLEAAGHQAGLLGTVANSDGQRSEPATMTTPDAPALAQWLARMEAAGCSHGVMEVSSHALSQSRLAGVQFDVACVTNVRHDHLDYHNTLQNYRSAKARIFDHLGPQACTVLNADDSVCRDYLKLLDGPVLTVGMKSPAEVTATLVERCASEQTFLVSAGCETAPVRTRMIGDHHIYNCLTAAAVGLVYGMELPQIARGLELVEQVPGRLERIECGQSFSAFVDYAHTPDALNATLETLRQVTFGRVICVFGAGGERDRKKRPLMARVVEQQADIAVVTDDNPRGEDSSQIVRDILRGFDSLADVLVMTDRAKAISWALQQAQEGDCVLIAGKGHEDYQIIGKHRHWFSDVEFVRQWLREHSWQLPLVSAGRRRINAA